MSKNTDTNPGGTMDNLIGSEKQIKWANGLLAKHGDRMARERAEAERDGSTRHLAYLDAVQQAVDTITHASDIIDGTVDAYWRRLYQVRQRGARKLASFIARGLLPEGTTYATDTNPGGTMEKIKASEIEKIYNSTEKYVVYWVSSDGQASTMMGGGNTEDGATQEAVRNLCNGDFTGGKLVCYEVVQ